MAVKYVALDLHQASTSISIRDVRGRVIRRNVVPTSAARILEVIDSAGGTIHVTLEEGTLSQRARTVLDTCGVCWWTDQIRVRIVASPKT